MLELVNIFNYVYEVLKQIIIILEGLSVINFIYKFIQNKCKPKYESLTIDLKSEITKLSELTKERTKNKELEAKLSDVKSELTKERTKNYDELIAKNTEIYSILSDSKLSDLKSELTKEKLINKELKAKISEITKEPTKLSDLKLKLSDLRSELTKEKLINKELNAKLSNLQLSDLKKEKLINKELKSILSDKEYTLSVVLKINNQLNNELIHLKSLKK
jgi:isoleucyl-tRNA synthetase